MHETFLACSVEIVAGEKCLSAFLLSLILVCSGPIAQRKDLSAVLLPPSALENKPSLPTDSDDPLIASALAALRCKFRREQFRRLPKKDGQEDGVNHSPRSAASTFSLRPPREDGSMASEPSDVDDDTDDVSSEVSSSGTDSSGDEGRNDAEMDAAISLAANLLKEEVKAGGLGAGAAPNADGVSAATVDGAVTASTNLARAPVQEPPQRMRWALQAGRAAR